MRVTFYHRRNAHGGFSIERVFNEVRKGLSPDIEYTVARCRYPSRGIWARLVNILEAPSHQGDVNHITGDVHFLSYLLNK